MNTTRRDLRQALQNVGFTYRDARKLVTVILSTSLTILKREGKLELPFGDLTLVPATPRRTIKFNRIVKTYTKPRVRFRKKD